MRWSLEKSFYLFFYLSLFVLVQNFMHVNYRYVGIFFSQEDGYPILLKTLVPEENLVKKKFDVYK